VQQPTYLRDPVCYTELKLIDKLINLLQVSKNKERERSEKEGEKNKEVWIERNTDKLRNSIEWNNTGRNNENIKNETEK